MLSFLLDEALGELDGSARAGVVQLAHLPLVTAEVARAVSLGRDLLTLAADAGLPFTPHRDGRWELPGPVAEHLAELAPLDPAAAERAARVYADRGEALRAVDLLAAAGRHADAAQLLAGLQPRWLDRLDVDELEDAVAALPDAALEEHARALLHVARAHEPAARLQRRTAALQRVLRIAVRRGDAPLAREVDAELARDLIRDGRAELAASVARACSTPPMTGRPLPACAPLTRSGARRRGGVTTRRSRPRSRCWRTPCGVAARTGSSPGRRRWRCRSRRGSTTRRRATSARSRWSTTRCTTCRSAAGTARWPSPSADFLDNCGRYDEATADLAEARNLAALTGDVRGLAYVAWESARNASQRGDAAAAAAAIRQVERQLGEWFAHATGAEFLADAADLLDRVGEPALARSYLDRAMERADECPLLVAVAVAVAEAAVAPRSGDPAEALALFDRLRGWSGVVPHERWRLALRAYAASRLADPRAGALAARAFDQAAALGDGLPFVREAIIADRLVGLAADAGSAAATRLLPHRDPPLTVTLLGGFGVARGACTKLRTTETVMRARHDRVGPPRRRGRAPGRRVLLHRRRAGRRARRHAGAAAGPPRRRNGPRRGRRVHRRVGAGASARPRRLAGARRHGHGPGGRPRALRRRARRRDQDDPARTGRQCSRVTRPRGSRCRDRRIARSPSRRE